MQMVQHLSEKAPITKQFRFGGEERSAYGDITIIEENITLCDQEINEDNVDDFLEVWMKIKKSIEGQILILKK